MTIVKGERVDSYNGNPREDVFASMGNRFDFVYAVDKKPSVRIQQIGLAMKIALLATATAMALAAGAAQAVTIPGTADPFLAGAPAGATVSWFGGGPFVDTAEAESPVSIAVTAGQTVNIYDVTGGVSNCTGCTLLGPTGAGGYNLDSAAFTATGFTPLVTSYSNLPINSLIGLFNGPSAAVFEIGNGGSFVVPTGATALYLAVADGYQWNNNIGSFSAIAAVPEPATWAMMLVGFGGLGAAMRARRKTLAAAA
jgi:hypothetical protein